MTQESDNEKILKEFMTLPGVGISKAKALLDAGFTNLEALAGVTPDDLKKRCKFSDKVAKEIAAHLAQRGGPQPLASKEEQSVQAGLSLYKEGKWGQALQEVENALKENPRSDRAHLVKGDIYFERERYDRAEEAYRKLVEFVPESDIANIKLGDSLAKQGRKHEADECYKKALAINPSNEDAQDRLESERLRTYVRGLDERMDGGIPSRYVVLVAGRAGSMKSSLVFNILYNLAKTEKKKAVYITLEQSRKSLMKHMVKLGFDPSGSKDLVVNDLDDLVIIDMAKLRKETGLGSAAGMDWVGSLINQIRKFRDSFGCDVLAIDSLSALYSLAEFKNPRAELFFFFERLRDLGITVFLVTEMTTPDKDVYGQYGVEEFLADGIIHMKTEKYGNKANLFLGIVKMRETKHERDYFPLIVDKEGFEIVAD